MSIRHSDLVHMVDHIWLCSLQLREKLCSSIHIHRFLCFLPWNLQNTFLTNFQSAVMMLHDYNWTLLTIDHLVLEGCETLRFVSPPASTQMAQWSTILCKRHDKGITCVFPVDSLAVDFETLFMSLCTSEKIWFKFSTFSCFRVFILSKREHMC